MAFLSRAIRNAAAMMRAQEWGSSSMIPGPSAGLSGLGAKGMDAALSIGTVLACVKALHDDAKVMPFRAFSGRRDGAHAPLPVQPRIVVEPFGPDLDPGAGFGQLVVSNRMRGNAFAYIVDVDPKTGMPAQLMILHPDGVKVRRDKRGKYFVVGQTEYGPDEIVHVTDFMLPGAVEGLDLLTYQRVTFELAAKVTAYGTSFFDSGGSPAGVISIPGPGDRKKARETQAMWESAHGGVVNSHRPAVMFGGATWQQLTVSPENAQFLETRRFLREEICGLYGVPLQRIQAIVDNASQGGGKGLDAIDAQYVKHGILPAIAGIEAAWDRMIPGSSSTFGMFDFTVFLRANAETQASIDQIHRVTGIRPIDEIRADHGWAPLPNGEGASAFVPLNSNTSPTGGADNAPKPGGQGGTP